MYNLPPRKDPLTAVTRQGWHMSYGTRKPGNAEGGEKQTESVVTWTQENWNYSYRKHLTSKVIIQMSITLWPICHPALKHKLISGPGGFLVQCCDKWQSLYYCLGFGGRMKSNCLKELKMRIALCCLSQLWAEMYKLIHTLLIYSFFFFLFVTKLNK